MPNCEQDGRREIRFTRVSRNFPFPYTTAPALRIQRSSLSAAASVARSQTTIQPVAPATQPVVGEALGQVVTQLLSPEGLLVGVTITPGLRGEKLQLSVCLDVGGTRAG